MLLILAAHLKRNKYGTLKALRDLFSPNVLLILAALPQCKKYAALTLLQDLFSPNVLLILVALLKRYKRCKTSSLPTYC